MVETEHGMVRENTENGRLNTAKLQIAKVVKQCKLIHIIIDCYSLCFHCRSTKREKSGHTYSTKRLLLSFFIGQPLPTTCPHQQLYLLLNVLFILNLESALPSAFHLFTTVGLLNWRLKKTIAVYFS